VIERRFPGDKILRLVTGDITRVAADAIVNAANSALAGGGGVDGAIHRVGGSSIMDELREIRRRIGSCPTGGAVATGPGALPARWVFHAVGPVYRGGGHGEAELLASCYRTCLRMAEERGAVSISFPSISTGAYGYPMAEAARIALDAVNAHLANSETTLKEIVFVLFGEAAYAVYSAGFQNWES
jgi:O-acetyl-ADP-ribose deacetylase (regulator of RNase III)